MRSCPKCRAGMAAVSYEGVEVDRCPQCQGHWLDRGEIKEICDRREKPFSEEERDRFFDELHAQQGRRKDWQALASALACPDCALPMARLEYAYSSTVVIDRCPGCDGLYLDAHELEKIQIWSEERDAYREHVRPEQAKNIGRSFFDAIGELLELLYSSSHRRW